MARDNPFSQGYFYPKIQRIDNHASIAAYPPAGTAAPLPMLGAAGSGGFQVLRLATAMHANLESPPELLPAAKAARSAGSAHRDTAAGTGFSSSSHRDIAGKTRWPWPPRKAALIICDTSRRTAVRLYI